MAFAVPELARRPALTGRPLVRTGLAISAVGVALLSVWGALLLLLPDEIGRMVLGDTWGPTSAILPASVIAMLVGIASIGPSAGVYAKGAVRVLFPLVLVGGPVYLVAGVLGVVVGGAFGAAAGFAVAGAYLSVISWVRFVMISRWRTGTG
jgi:O-antigen/teichoic acid export membrane protein